MTLGTLITNLSEKLIDPLVPLLIGLAVIVFFWGLVKYLNSGLGDTKKIEEARNMMIWGLIVITVMVSIWGIVQIVQTTFFGTTPINTAPTPPKFSATGGESFEDLNAPCDMNAPAGDPNACPTE